MRHIEINTRILTAIISAAVLVIVPVSADDKELPGIGIKKATFTTIINKPDTSTDKVEGKEVEYCLWYNPKNWKLLEENLNDVSEYSFKLNDGDAFAMVIPEEEITPLKDAPYIIIEGAKMSGVEDIEIIEMENHMVNGTEVLYLVWSGRLMNTNFTYIYNIYSGEKGTVQVVAYTLDSFLQLNQDTMNNLLNGFCIHSNQKK